MQDDLPATTIFVRTMHDRTFSILDQYGTTEVPLTRDFSICFMTLHTKYNGGTTKLLSCVHETENVSTALVLGHENCELKRIVLVIYLLCAVPKNSLKL